MSITEKIKAINNKAQYNLDRQTDNMLRFQLYHQKMLINMDF